MGPTTDIQLSSKVRPADANATASPTRKAQLSREALNEVHIMQHRRFCFKHAGLEEAALGGLFWRGEVEVVVIECAAIELLKNSLIRRHSAQRPSVFIYEIADCGVRHFNMSRPPAKIQSLIYLSLPKTIFVHIDDGSDQESGVQQHRRTAGWREGGARPSRAKHEFARHYNRWRISLGFVEGGGTLTHWNGS
jgi:hypothetical protein